MNLNRIFEIIIPSPRAYINFCMLWLFLAVLASNREQTIVLLCAFADVYFLNEWSKEVLKEKRKQ